MGILFLFLGVLASRAILVLALELSARMAAEDGADGTGAFVARMHRFRSHILRYPWKVNVEPEERRLEILCLSGTALAFVAGGTIFANPMPFFFLVFVLGALACADYLTETIPDSLTLIAGAAAAWHSWVLIGEPFAAGLTLSAPFAVMALLFGRLPIVSGRMGFGDCKLIAALIIGLGAFWGGFALLAGSVAGIGARLVSGNRGEECYGPWIAFGAVAACLTRGIALTG